VLFKNWYLSTGEKLGGRALHIIARFTSSRPNLLLLDR